MKANVNYNLKGDEEPGVEGPKPQIYNQLGMTTGKKNILFSKKNIFLRGVHIGQIKPLF